MRLFIRLAIFFYVFVLSLVGFTALLVLAHFVDYVAYLDFLKFIYQDGNASTIAGAIIASTLLISLVFARVIYGRQEQERLIHFDNPLGRVTISLSAIEDLIRRLVVHTPQIKEIRPAIISTKKGLEIEIRLVLRSDVNIPEMTADLQDIIKRKVQDVIGSEETVNICVHVIKIAPESSRQGKGSDDEGQSIGSSIPFHGYRA
jgi:hypothetical protein